MTLDEIYQQFDACKSWEQRYRLLIQLSRELPTLSDAEKQTISEISGCESRLWFEIQLDPRMVRCGSEARLMQGILMIIRTALLESSVEQLREWQLSAMLERLNLTSSLSSSRLNGLAQIQQRIEQAVK